MKADKQFLQKKLPLWLAYALMPILAGIFVYYDYEYLLGSSRTYILNILYFILITLLVSFGALGYYFSYYRKQVEVREFYSELIYPLILGISLNVLVVEAFKFMKLGVNGVDTGSFMAATSISILGMILLVGFNAWSKIESKTYDLRNIFNILTPSILLLMPILFIPGLRSLGVFFAVSIAISYLSVFLYKKLLK